MAKMNGVFRLGKDGELQRTHNGETVLNLALAYSYGKKQANGQRPTQWVNAALWGRRAEQLAPWLKKGTQIVAWLSDLHIETYQTRDGRNGAALQARIDDLEFTGGSQGQPHIEGNTKDQAPDLDEPTDDWGNGPTGIPGLDDPIPF